MRSVPTIQIGNSPLVGDRFVVRDDPDRQEFEVTEVDHTIGRIVYIDVLTGAIYKASTNSFDMFCDLIPRLPCGIRSIINETSEPMFVKCECGVDKLGYGNHSDYCPKSKIGG